MNVFPIATSELARAQFAQAFNEQHPATDIFAPAGAQVVAVADGKVRHAIENKGGKAVYLTTSDGTQYYYAHLDAFADPMQPTETRDVKSGDLLGYVGTTGSAKGTPPHVHFEWRPQGGAKRDPYPELARVAKMAVPGQISRKSNVIQFPTKKKAGRSSSTFDGLGWLLLLFVAAKGLR